MRLSMTDRPDLREECCCLFGRIRVLLVSPLASGGESNGDTQYTEGLLTYPPSGVEYVSTSPAMSRSEKVVPVSSKSLRECGADYLRVRLTVAGPDRPDPHLPGVTWFGCCSRAALYERSIQADVFVYPTSFDCAPLVVMETMAHGLPVGRDQSATTSWPPLTAG